MLNENLVHSMIKSIAQTHAESYTKLFPCAKIYSYANKRSYEVGNQVVIESDKIVNSQEVPTHEIIELQGTLQDTRHVISVRNLSTQEVLKIDL